MRRRKRIRVRRSMLTVLALLLELNHFLPGTWPGGTDGGFRRWSVRTPSSERLRPPEGDLPPLEPDAITVVLRGGGRGLEVAVDAPGQDRKRPDARGYVSLGGDRLLASGFLIRGDDETVRHGAADPAVARTWTVHLPDPLPGSPGEAGPLEIQVLAEESGRPLGNVEVKIRTPGATLERRTDDQGRVVLEDLEGRARVVVEAAGRGTVEQWVHPRETRALELTLRRIPRIASRFTSSDGSRATVTKLRVVSPDGRVLWEANPTLESMPFDVGTRADLEDARLEIWTPDHAVVRLPLDDLPPEIELPEGRTFQIDALDRGSRRLTGVRVTAHYVPEDLAGAPTIGLEPLEVAVMGADTVVLPRGHRARLVVEALGSAPATLEIGAEEDPGRRKIRLDVGRSLHVTVTDAGGEPVAGATVIALATVGTATVRRSETTLPDGTTRLVELPSSPVEVYAKARGTAWAAAVLGELKDGKNAVELRLQPGRTLRLVVESPLGLPLEGVRVHAEPVGAGPQDVIPPDARPWRTGRAGTLVLDDLRDRDYRVRLSLPGYEATTVDEIRPGPGVHFVTLRPNRP